MKLNHTSQVRVPTPKSTPKTEKTKVLFLSDLDGTWLGEQRDLLDHGMEDIRSEYAQKGIDFKFGFVTGRPPERLDKGLPKADFKITFNGGRIEDGQGEIENWNTKNEASGFDNDALQQSFSVLLQTPQYQNLSYQTVGQVVGNIAADASEFDTSFCLDQNSIALTESERVDNNHNNIPDILESKTFKVPAQVQNLLNDLSEDLESQGMGYRIAKPYLFHGKPFLSLDIAAPDANKGDAVTFLAQQEGVRPDHLIVACDGGNDLPMVQLKGGEDFGRRTIVVGHEQILREAAAPLKNSIIRPENEDSSLGVYKGLRQHLDTIVAELSATQKAS